MKKMNTAIKFIGALGVMIMMLTAPSISIANISSINNSGCDSISVTGMPETAIIDLKKKCIEMTKPSLNVDSMNEYAELGKKYGIALSEVAKQIGTTVNELAQTPVGKFMLIMVAYKVMGDTVIGVLGGIIWFTTMLPIWLYLLHKLILRNTKTKTYYDKDQNQVVEHMPVELTGDSFGLLFMFFVALLMICAAGFIMIF